MNNLGDFDTSAVVYGKFTSRRPSTGASFTLGGTPALSVYKDNSTTQTTTGVTLTADFDSVTGLNQFAIDTSADGSFYSAGSFFEVVITTGTVDSVSVTGTVVGCFTLRKTSALKPTTAGRTLDVSVGGEAGLDWNNIGSPTITVNLSGTTVKTATDVETDTADIQSRLPASLVSGRIDASVGAMDTDVITSTALAASAVTEIQSGLATSSALSSVASDVTAVGVIVTAIEVDTQDIQGRLPAALVSGRIDASVGAMAADVLTSSALAASAVTEIQAGLATATNVDDAETAILAAIDAVPTAAENVTALKAATLDAPRNISAIADGSLTVNDALHCAIACAAGKETVVGTTYTVMTPSTGTTIRVFTLDNASTPTSRT